MRCAKAVGGAVLYSGYSVPIITTGFSFRLLITAISHLGFPSIKGWQSAVSQGYFILLPTSFIRSQSGWYVNNG